MWLIAAIVVTYRRKRQGKSGITYSKMQAGILPSARSSMVRRNIDEIARRRSELFHLEELRSE
jgi:hypothetical protein